MGIVADMEQMNQVWPMDPKMVQNCYGDDNFVMLAVDSDVAADDEDFAVGIVSLPMVGEAHYPSDEMGMVNLAWATLRLSSETDRLS